MSERYITDRFLPDKAIDLLDEGCSCASLRNKELAEFDTLGLKFAKVKEDELKTEQDSNTDYEKLAGLKAELLRIDERMKVLEPAAMSAAVTK
ncbi:MAG: ATP-dependent Clp protease ATP-binding subunit, partial [Ruthenibacterium sp.]